MSTSESEKETNISEKENNITEKEHNFIQKIIVIPEFCGHCNKKFVKKISTAFITNHILFLFSLLNTISKKNFQNQI